MEKDAAAMGRCRGGSGSNDYIESLYICIWVDTVSTEYEMSILDTETRNGYAIVSAQDIATWDVTLHVGVYIDADMDCCVKGAEVQWSVSDLPWIPFHKYGRRINI